jgi:hypothetical protein
MRKTSADMGWTEKFRFEDHYVYPSLDGCHYDTETDLIMTGLFGFCGCGLPDECMRYIAGCLRGIADLSAANEKNDGKWDHYYKLVQEYEPNDGARYLLWYVLDNAELTEHGCGVPGWPTEKGLEVLEDMERIIAEDDRC